MKKIVICTAVAIFLVLLPVFSVSATNVIETETFGSNLEWFLYDNGKLEISGTSSIPDFSNASEQPWSHIRTSITTITINSGVTSIGKSAFANCENLADITIPESVTSIGNTAFYGCTALETITILPTVTTIGNYAFEGCEVLEIHGYTDSTAELYALENDITFVSLGTAIQKCGENTTWTLKPNGELFISGIGDMYDYICTWDIDGYSSDSPWFNVREKITKVIIDDNVESIGKYAFVDCNNITQVKFGKNLKTIRDNAFTDCNGITEIIFNSSLETIGSNGFWGLRSLKSLVIPDSVTTMGDGAFKYCRKLESITIGKSITHIGASTFYYCNLKTVIIGENVTSIDNSAFDESGSNLTIKCFKGSAAHIFAMNNNINFEIISLSESEASEDDIYILGAQLRLDQENFKTDMRFVIRISKDFLKDKGITEYEGENVKFGSLVLPFENGYMVDGDTLSLVSKTTEGWNPAKVPAINKFKEDTSYTYYTVCITDIALYERYYAVRPYVTVSDTEYVYGAQYQTANLHDVCVLAAEDFLNKGGNIPAAITNIFYTCGHNETIGKYNDNEVIVPWGKI